jgi:hypothetical protein
MINRCILIRPARDCDISSTRFEAQSRAELDRMFTLVDPRPSIPSDADAVSIAECRRICALNPPERKRPTGVQHNLNLLRGLQIDTARTENR